MADTRIATGALDTHEESSHITKGGQDTTRSSQPIADDEKGTVSLSSDDDNDGIPTEEELLTLRRVRDHIPLKVFTVAFIELCERFSYYGTTVVFTNFIQQPLPDGSRTGAAGVKGQAGALGKGQRASTGLSTFNQFWVYFTPLIGAYIADTYLGRFKTIWISTIIALVGHVILVASAAPGVLANPNSALAAFIIGLIIMGTGTGGFKPNISTLIGEQLPREKKKVINTKDGERVIVDPAVTAASVYMWFYFFINIGALVGQIGMAYCEYYVGFWLAFLLPTILISFCPLVMYFCRNIYHRTPPAGSVLAPALRIFFLAQKGRWSINPLKTRRNMCDGTFWEKVKPSNIPESQRPKWMTFDDHWVDEVGRGFAACSVFLWLPLFWLCYNQINNNLTSQAAVMKLNGVPNDVVSNLNPFALITMIPILDRFVYPFLRKMGINFSPLKRIALGFFSGCAAMIWACIVQVYIYRTSECGKYAAGKECKPTDIIVWAQTGSYVLIAFAEIMASITSLEYAFTKAPRNMRSLVMAFGLFMNAFAAAIGQALVSLSADPLLVWNYATVAILAFIGGTCFWLQYRKLDAQEDHLNMLPTGRVGTEKEDRGLDIERRRQSIRDPNN